MLTSFDKIETAIIAAGPVLLKFHSCFLNLYNDEHTGLITSKNKF